MKSEQFNLSSEKESVHNWKQDQTKPVDVTFIMTFCSGNSVVRVRAQVMMRDDSTGGWVPMGGGGLSNVSVRKRKVHHEENDQPCKHEYLIYGKRISDQSVSNDPINPLATSNFIRI